jgi:SAM-dependent methyltransferase
VTEERFRFGQNWRLFLEGLDDQTISLAQEALCKMLEMKSLKGLNFVDIGSGSGLSSLVARRLGAKVHSFDYDQDSVGCTQELRRRYFADDPDWVVEQGSALDKEYLSQLGTFDIVYSWGVLHHTGSMWEALENVVHMVKPGGILFIAIYNDQGKPSKRWWWVKRTYVRLPGFLRFTVLIPAFIHLWWRRMLRDVLTLQPGKSWREYSDRGMSPWRDVVDWVGGFPFEVALPEEIFSFYRDRGFELRQLKTQRGSLGCVEFVFRRSHTRAAAL